MVRSRVVGSGSRGMRVVEKWGDRDLRSDGDQEVWV